MAAQEVPKSRTATGIVVYHPDFEAVLRLVASVAAASAVIGIYANSPVSQEQQRALEAAGGGSLLLVLRPGANRGVGHAYNALHGMARAHGAGFLLLLDQDSEPCPEMLQRLLEVHRRLEAAGERAAVVAPAPIDPAGRPMKIAGRRRRGAPADAPVRVRFAISSGSLLRLSALEAVGGFRADYFIDAIDVEWCMRAVARGFSIWAAPDTPMRHRLGQGIIPLPLGLALTDQPPLRLYTFVRNQLAMLRLGHVPLAYKLRLVASLPARFAIYLVRNSNSRACRNAFVNGVLDGLGGRLGPPDGALMSRRHQAWSLLKQALAEEEQPTPRVR